jgi:FSR family fosmidomycin resistance protein-like MFS transporter
VRKNNDAAVIGLVSAAHGTSHFFQIIVAPLFPLIKDELGVSYAALGFAMTLFYALSALCQPVAGFVVDRLGARGMLVGGLGLMVAGIALVGLSQSYALLVAGMIVAGIGNSVFHPADFTILNSRVAAARLGYAYSAHGMAGALGYAAAPLFSGGLAVLFGWHAALLAGTGVGVGVVLLLLANWSRLRAVAEEPGSVKRPFAEDVRVLASVPVVLCFLYFAIWCSGLVGIQHFSVAALTLQYGVSTALASGALTAYMVGSAAGIFAGGFIATRAARHDVVAASGLAAGAALILAVATGQLPGGALPVMLALTGFAVGATGPSRDLIVRASTPPGATGRVYGFVYSGLDVGSLTTPVLYGWLLDHQLPQGVFYTVFAFTGLAIFTVLQLPGKARRVAAA